MNTPLAALLSASALAACSAGPATAPDAAPVAAPARAPAPAPLLGGFTDGTLTVTVTHDEQDKELAEELAATLEAEARRVEALLGLPFRDPFAVRLAPDRAAFDALFPPEWGLGETQCWMVATGVADWMALLSPRVWRSEACEHDPDDAEHLRLLLAHELVHVLHGQYNPTRDFTGAEEVGWFAEGLATWASGQLAAEHADDARQAVEAGAAPADLVHAWSGRYRYGVCGSLVQHLDEHAGRERLREALGATTQAELLGILGVDEAGLLGAWAEAARAE